MDFNHIISFLKEYNSILDDSFKININDFESHKLIQLKLKVLTRSFFDDLSKRNEMDFVDEFVQLYNEVWTPDYDDQYENDKQTIELSKSTI